MYFQKAIRIEDCVFTLKVDFLFSEVEYGKLTSYIGATWHCDDFEPIEYNEGELMGRGDGKTLPPDHIWTRLVAAAEAFSAEMWALNPIPSECDHIPGAATSLLDIQQGAANRFKGAIR